MDKCGDHKVTTDVTISSEKKSSVAERMNLGAEQWILP